jgi:DNA ligase-associated metallophosphoesterase
MQLSFRGQALALDPAGALYWPARELLVVADLHLEKGSAFARRGALLPPYDTHATLARLEALVRRWRPAILVSLGDGFHDRRGPRELSPDLFDRLGALTRALRWVWVTGNHDRVLPGTIGGEIVAELPLGPLTLRHEPERRAEAEIAGHLHPVGKVVMRGRGVRRRCFLADGSRCVMPAFGAYAGGLNACDAAFRPLFPNGFTAHLIGDGRLFAIGRGMLCRD